MDNECTLVLYQTLEFPDMATNKNAYITHIGIELPNGGVINLETGNIYPKEDLGEKLIDNKPLYIIHRYAEWRDIDCIDFEDEIRYTQKWWDKEQATTKERTIKEVFEEAPVGSMITTEFDNDYYTYYKANDKWSILCDSDGAQLYRPQDFSLKEKVIKIVTNTEEIEDVYRVW